VVWGSEMCPSSFAKASSVAKAMEYKMEGKSASSGSSLRGVDFAFLTRSAAILIMQSENPIDVLHKLPLLSE
jgi:hypothetical protein